MFRDDYTNFSFNEQDSSKFKVWITNKNNLQSNMSPNFSDKFNSPTYGQIRYHEGTTIDKQDFKLSCVAVDITLNEWRAITEWLSPLKIGKLRFDWNSRFYYIVKLNKGPQGEMFIKNKIDKIMGPLFNVTFTLEFTTVSDWAACGQDCVQKVWNGISQIDVGAYLNPYYIPQIIYDDNRVEDYGTIEGNILYKLKTYADISFSTASFRSGPGTIVIKDKNNNITDTITIENDEEGSLPTVLRTYVISPTQSLTAVINNITLTDDYYHFMILTNNGCSLVQEKESVNPSDSVKLKTYNDSNVILANPGSYTLYPRFTVKNGCIIKDKQTTYYKYVPNTDEDFYIDINCQSGFVTSMGAIVETIKDTKGRPIIISDKTVNNNLYIKSGRPELLKTIFVKDESDGADSPWHTATFLINNAPIYTRNTKFLLHIYTDYFAKAVNVYARDPYNSGDYYYNLNNSKRILLDSPDISLERTKQGCKLKIRYWGEKIDTGTEEKQIKDFGDFYTNILNLSEFEENSYLYIALCDYEDYTINDGKDEGMLDNFYISSNTREVI